MEALESGAQGSCLSLDAGSLGDPGQSLTPQGLCFQVCRMGTIAPATRTAGSMLEVTAGDGGLWGLRGCGCSWVHHVPIRFVFSSSPFMNKLFPAGFPNRQYQLLFTQGSGENKEGQRCPPSPAWAVSPIHPHPPPATPTLVPLTLGLLGRANDGWGRWALGSPCPGSHPSSATACRGDSG